MQVRRIADCGLRGRWNSRFNQQEISLSMPGAWLLLRPFSTGLAGVWPRVPTPHQPFWPRPRTSRRYSSFENCFKSTVQRMCCVCVWELERMKQLWLSRSMMKSDLPLPQIGHGQGREAVNGGWCVYFPPMVLLAASRVGSRDW
jgi:hypothetical protein